jgi:AraC-like DNA-binding protein
MSTPRANKIRQYSIALAKIGIHSNIVQIHADRAGNLARTGQDLDQPGYLGALSAIVRTAPPDFALRFGAHRRLADLGLVGHAILSAGGLRNATKVWSNFSHLAGEPIRFATQIADDYWRLEFTPMSILSPALAQFCTEELSASFFAFAQEIASPDFTKACTEFRHARRKDVDYDAALPGKQRFGCAGHAIILPAPIIDTSPHPRDDEILEVLLSYLAQRPSTEFNGGVTGQIRYLLASAAAPSLKLADAAQALGLSSRTLNRRLAEEGVCFRTLVGEFRRDYVQALARETGASAKQLAFAAGYRNDQSLRRAFRTWTDTPLREWTKRERKARKTHAP